MLPDFQNTKILVVGDVMLDRYWHGKAARISPEAPVPVVKVNEIEERLGGAANVALNLASLGCEVTLLGCVGDDEAADSMSNCLSKSKIGNQLITDATRPTITKLRIISQQQQLIRLDFEEKFEVDDSMRESFEKLVDDFHVVIFSDYDKGTLAQVSELIGIAKSKNKKIIVDPKGNDFSKYGGSSLITPNAGEFRAVVGDFADNGELEMLARKLLKDISLEAILITRGEDGMSLISQDDATHIPALAREVFDVTGAGDTVISVLAAAQACNKTLEESAELANVAAGIVVAKLGTATVSVAELRQALKRHIKHQLGVVNETELLEFMVDARLRGEKIVMTNGCFDILHAGHVGYLEQARQLGDRLVVAVNDDSSVKRLKGGSRPIVPLEQRMAVLSGLSSVDLVTSFSEDTPEKLICLACPDVLVKGGDYKADEIAGYHCVIEGGGEVKVMSFSDGISTSTIVDVIKNAD